jgi:hypothetical protein
MADLPIVGERGFTERWLHIPAASEVQVDFNLYAGR